MKVIVNNEIYVQNASSELYWWARQNLVVTNPKYETLMRLNKQDQITRYHIEPKMRLYVEVGLDLILPFGCLYAIWPMIRNCEIIREFNSSKPINCPYDKITQPLYDYQEEAVQKMVAAKSGILIGGCGSGKTNCGIEIIHRIGKNALWLTHTKDLLRQTVGRIKSLYPNMHVGTITEGKVDMVQDGITVSTIQTLVNIPSRIYRDKFEVVVTDECFSGDTEILTDKGFKRFDELNGDELVAQYENGKIVSFVKPIRLVKTKTDKYVSFKHNDTEIIVTPNHNMVSIDVVSNKEFVRPAIDFVDYTLQNHRFITNANIEVDKMQALSDLEKIKIMIQADGCLYYRSKTGNFDTYKLEFSKERKIKRFKELCENAGVPYKEYTKRSFENPKWKDSTKFCIKMPRDENNYKILSNFLEQPKNSQYAADILEEIAQWDGHERECDHGIEYDSIIKENCDFVQMCAFLANKKHSKVFTTFAQSKVRRPVYRVYFNQRENKYYYRFDRKLVERNIDAYCVEVPTHKIIVKKDNFIFVCGNCHHVSGSPTLQKHFVKIVTAIPARYKYGLTASDKRNDTLTKSMYATIGCNLKGEFEPVWRIARKDANTLTATHLKIELDTPFDYCMLNDDGTFNYPALVDYIATYEPRNDAICSKVLEMSKEGRKQLVLCSRIEQCELLYKKLLDLGLKAVLLVGKVSSKKRDEILTQKVDWEVIVATISLAKEGLDVVNLDTLHLASCISNKSDTVQSVGRIERVCEGKKEPIALDYVDIKIPYLVSRYKKRVNWLKRR